MEWGKSRIRKTIWEVMEAFEGRDGGGLDSSATSECDDDKGWMLMYVLETGA